jgi:hypothetical protein
MPQCSVTVYKVMTPPPPSKTEAATAAAGTTPVGENAPDSFVTRYYFKSWLFSLESSVLTGEYRGWKLSNRR